MAESQEPIPGKIDYVRTTKKQLFDAYNELRKQLEEKRKAEQTPEQKIEEKSVKRAVEEADSLSTEGISKEIGKLKTEIGKTLSDLSECLEKAVEKHQTVKTAIETKEKELEEIYEIQRSASSLAALMELHRRQKEEFESEIALKRSRLEEEIESTRASWEKEKALYAKEEKEREEQERKQRQREKEEFEYASKREKEITRQKMEDELADLRREVSLKKGELERDLGERERQVAAKEEELRVLRETVEATPKQTEVTVNKAVKEATERVSLEAANKEQLLRKEFEGERNVLTSQIAALEKTVHEQAEQIASQARQLEKSYNQVQDIATKAIEGSSSTKSLASLEKMLAEQPRKVAQES